MNLKQLKKNKKGFTLIEIIVVIVILAVLLAIAVPSVMKYIDEANKAKYYSQARAAFNQAQIEVAKNYAQTGTVSNYSESNPDITGTPTVSKIEATVTKADSSKEYEITKVTVTFGDGKVVTVDPNEKMTLS